MIPIFVLHDQTKECNNKCMKTYRSSDQSLNDIFSRNYFDQSRVYGRVFLMKSMCDEVSLSTKKREKERGRETTNDVLFNVNLHY